MQENTQASFSDIEWQEKENNINLNKIVGALLASLPWFIGCLIISLIIAFLYLRYTAPVYQITAQVLIKDDKQDAMSDEALLQDLGMQPNLKNLANEMIILNSRRLMTDVVKDLELNVHYTIPGRLTTTEIYKERPFIFSLNEAENDSLKKTRILKLKQNGDGYKLTLGKADYAGKWGDSISLPIGMALLEKTKYPFSANITEYTITVDPIERAVNHYIKAVNVALPNKSSTVLLLTMKDQLPDRGVAALDKLIEVYQQANIDDKNTIANNTMSFIDYRLKIVTDELSDVEKTIENYRRSTDGIDMKVQSQILLQSTSEMEHKIVEQQVQLSVIDALEEYIKASKDPRTVPATLVSESGTFTNVIATYNALLMRRDQLLLTSTENNPTVISINEQLAALKQGLLNSLQAVKKDLNVRIAEMRKKEGSVTGEIKEIPTKERIFLEYSRQQQIKQELYLFLLKKREETAIGKSTTIANSRVIEPARNSGGPFAPKRSMIFLTAFLIGILVPAAVIYLKSLLNTRINSRADINALTKLSIAGEIGHSDNQDTLVVMPGARSVIAEQFRALRTNIEFLLATENEKVVMLTSSMSGEGKSFVSLNVASTLALSGKRVVLMELDLRKPKISKYLNLDNATGFSNYAIGHADYDKIIVPSGVQDNFFIIPSGPIPPNPSELIILPKIAELFAQLRKDFDYVVVDTAPIGFVTDAQLLARYADAVLYLVRQGYTYKQQIQLADELYRTRKMPKMSLIVNDVKVSRGYGYGYGYYSYGYGYGYGNYGGYFEGKNKNANILQKFINRFQNRNKE
ncbi:MAG: GumC family protein [Flavipsychrobacter sp.]